MDLTRSTVQLLPSKSRRVEEGRSLKLKKSGITRKMGINFDIGNILKFPQRIKIVELVLLLRFINIILEIIIHKVPNILHRFYHSFV